MKYGSCSTGTRQTRRNERGRLESKMKQDQERVLVPEKEEESRLSERKKMRARDQKIITCYCLRPSRGKIFKHCFFELAHRKKDKIDFKKNFKKEMKGLGLRTLSPFNFWSLVLVNGATGSMGLHKSNSLNIL